MKKFDVVVGFTGSEVERAALATTVFPVEPRFERRFEQKLIKDLPGSAITLTR